MTLPSWSLKLAAAAVIPVILGVGVAMSAPSQTQVQPLGVKAADYAADSEMHPSKLGVDVTLVTGPTTSEVGKSIDCDARSWPIVPFACRKKISWISPEVSSTK
jgi:hypothetical protein